MGMMSGEINRMILIRFLYIKNSKMVKFKFNMRRLTICWRRVDLISIQMQVLSSKIVRFPISDRLTAVSLNLDEQPKMIAKTNTKP